MKKIKVFSFTSARSDYDLLYPVLREFKNSKKIDHQLLVCGSHLSEMYGKTLSHIKRDGFKKILKIKSIESDKTKLDILKSFNAITKKLSFIIHRQNPDVLVLLGDRYETFAAANVAKILNINIAHISGGDTSHGSIDENFRNSISMMSDIHFVKTNLHKKKLLSFKIPKKNIFNIGSLSVENFNKNIKSSKKGFKKPFCLITFHPVTQKPKKEDNDITQLFKALKYFKELNLIFTGANQDFGGREINIKIKKFIRSNKKSQFFMNLGKINYHYAMSKCEFMIGNSSSAIIESMLYKKPVINILPRQIGRQKNKNVIDVSNKKNFLIKSIKKAMSDNFKKKVNLSNDIFKVKKLGFSPSKFILKEIIKNYGK